MRQFLGAVLMITLLVTMLAVPASAAAYVETITWMHTQSYYNELNDGNGPILFAFEPSFLGSSPSAATVISIPAGRTGRVLTGISQHDDHANSTSSNEEVNGMVYCSVMFRTVNGYTPIYASKTYHYANRRVAEGTSGISYWEYTYISPNHDLELNSNPVVPVTEGMTVGGP